MIVKLNKWHLILISLFIASCSSVPNISETDSPAEIIQRAQEASDRNKYKLAQLYYEALLERAGSNIDLVITAKYEIGFVYYKQKKYKLAASELNEVLEIFDSPDAILFPKQYKVLTQIVLDRISEKEKPLIKWGKKETKISEDDPFQGY
jgi:tetratricopeptide (TPR) repeat protein